MMEKFGGTGWSDVERRAFLKVLTPSHIIRRYRAPAGESSLLEFMT